MRFAVLSLMLLLVACGTPRPRSTNKLPSSVLCVEATCTISEYQILELGKNRIRDLMNFPKETEFTNLRLVNYQGEPVVCGRVNDPYAPGEDPSLRWFFVTGRHHMIQPSDDLVRRSGINILPLQALLETRCGGRLPWLKANDPYDPR
jgi:hypothetical protein